MLKFWLIFKFLLYRINKYNQESSSYNSKNIVILHRKSILEYFEK